jgi:hypothetical protein
VIVMRIVVMVCWPAGKEKPHFVSVLVTQGVTLLTGNTFGAWNVIPAEPVSNATGCVPARMFRCRLRPRWHLHFVPTYSSWPTAFRGLRIWF